MKKFCSYFSVIALSFLLITMNVSAAAVVEDINSGGGSTGTIVDNTAQTNVLGFCTKAAPVLQVFGYFLLIIKIVIPLIIIILGSIDFGNAVLSGEDKAIKDSAMKLLKRVLIGIVVFLIPTIVRVIYFEIYHLRGITEVKNESTVCIDCLTSPSKCKQTERDIFK